LLVVRCGPARARAARARAAGCHARGSRSRWRGAGAPGRERLLSPSRSSRASRDPVEAPDGTAAVPSTPLEVRTSTARVGLPRESRISLAWTDEMLSSLTGPPRKVRGG
jgi:hypothetical protein